MKNSKFETILERIIGSFYEDDEINEVIFNGYDNALAITYGKNSFCRLQPRNFFSSALEFSNWMMEFSYRNLRRLDPLLPMQGGDYSQGKYRWHAVLPPMASRGGVFTLRRHKADVFTLDQYASQSCPKEIAALDFAVENDHHVFFCGPTGIGKTTLLVAVMQHYWSERRVCILEKVPEINRQNPGWIYLRTRDPFLSGSPEVSLETLMVEALRLSPEKLCIPEIRREEVSAFLLAANSGHGGVLSTMHVSSAQEFKNRVIKSGLTGLQDLSKPVLLVFLRRCSIKGDLDQDHHLRKFPKIVTHKFEI